jgi:hypothetical protein
MTQEQGGCYGDPGTLPTNRSKRYCKYWWKAGNKSDQSLIVAIWRTARE